MKYPLVPPLVVCVLGIVAGYYGVGNEDSWLLPSVCATGVAGLCGFLAIARKWRTAFLLACIFLASVSSVKIRLNPRLPKDHIVHLPKGTPTLLEGTLYRDPLFDETHTKLFLRTSLVRGPGPPKRVQGDLELFLPERLEHLREGDIVVVEARLRDPRTYGNPGESDLVKRRFLKRIYVQGTVAEAFRLIHLGNAKHFGIRSLVAAVRDHTRAFLRQVHDPCAQGLLYGLIVGDKSLIPQEVRESFRKTGLSHLLAISGLHVGLVGLFVYGSVRFLLKRSSWILVRWPIRKVAAVSSLPCAAFYVLIAGSPVTAVRALLMGLVVIGAVLSNRVTAVNNGVALAALVILIVEPGSLFSPAFQLSFAAVVAITTGASRLKDLIHKTPDQPEGTRTRMSLVSSWLFKRLTEALCVSVAALLGTAPLIGYYFYQINLVGIIANVLVVPLVGWIAIPCAFVASMLSIVSRAIATVPLACSVWVLKAAMATAAALSKVPFASPHIGSPTLAEMVVWYFALILLVWKPRTRLWRLCVVGCGVFFCLSGIWAWLGPRFSTDLVVTFLSVGQGQSIFVELPGGKRMLIDGGTAREGAFDTGRHIIAPYLWRRRIKRVDYLVVSHGEADHYGGLPYLVEHFEVSEVWTGPSEDDEAEGYKCFLALCQSHGIARRILHDGTRPMVINGVVMHVLNPGIPDSTDVSSVSDSTILTRNDRSLVLKVVYGSTSFLFTGDIGVNTEQRLTSLYGDMLNTAVLAVPHHGSDSSSSESFIRKVCPDIAIVATGVGNRFGFPKQTVIDRYRRLGVRLYRTDLDGAVCVRSSGTGYSVTTHAREPLRAVASIGYQ